MRRSELPVGLVAASCLWMSAAQGAAPGDADSPPPGRWEVVAEGGGPAIRDAETGGWVLAPAGEPLHVCGKGSCATPRVELVPAPAGFDLVLDFTNDSGRPQSLGAVRLGPFPMGDRVAYHDFHLDGKPLIADATADPAPWAWTYPAHLYSPVAVFRSLDHVVGVSVQYPFLEHQHDVGVHLWSPPPGDDADGPRGWFVDIRLSNLGDERGARRLRHPASIEPGQSRTYTVSVRVEADQKQWLRTLLPYRDYFRALYGGVRYERDPRPVYGVITAAQARITAQNPYGFAGDDLRPDLHGYGPLVDTILGKRNEWDRVMIWTASGLYDDNRENNMPFKFASHWLEGALHGHRMGDAVAQFGRVAASGVTLGFWWGRSAQVVEAWDPVEKMALDPAKPEHVALAFRELDLAAQAGATLIGLDAFFHFHCPAWRLYAWLSQMRERHPGVKFVTEGRNPDFMHTLAPTWVDLFAVPEAAEREGLYLVTTPMYLADFLLPGSETWCGVQFNRFTSFTGVTPSPQAVEREIQNVASKGYVPVVFSDVKRTGPFRAAATWGATVPEGLRLEPAIDPSAPVHVDLARVDNRAESPDESAPD